MKAYDYEAVVYDGAVYCVECCPPEADEDEVEPIFADDEWPAPGPVCNECGYVHNYMALTEDYDA